VEQQETITRDSVTVKVNAVLLVPNPRSRKAILSWKFSDGHLSVAS